MHTAELGSMSPGDVYALREAWQRREQRADLRAGQICFLLAETNRNREKNPWPFSPADFFPSLEEFRPDPPSEADLERKLDAMAGG